MITIEQVIFVIPILALTASILYYTLNLRTANKAQQLNIESRQAQLYMQLLLTVSNPTFHDTAIDVFNLPSETEEDLEKLFENNEAIKKMASIFRHHDGLGTMVKKGYLDVEMLDGIDGGTAYIRCWDKWEKHILNVRETQNRDEYMKGFEYLKNAVIELRKSKGLPVTWSETENKFI